MKKIFTLLTAILLCSGMVVQAQLLDAVNDNPQGVLALLGDDSGSDKYPVVASGRRAPEAAQLETIETTYDAVGGFMNTDFRTTQGYNLYQLHIYLDAIDNQMLCFCITVNCSSSTSYESTSFRTNMTSIYEYTSMGASIGGSKVTGNDNNVACSGSVSRIWGDCYLIDIYATGNGALNKVYHIKAWAFMGTNYYQNDDNVRYAQVASSASSSRSGSNTLLQLTANTYYKTKLYFNSTGGATNVSTGRYSIDGSSTSSGTVRASNYADNQSPSRITYDRSGYVKHYWYPMCGKVDVINPNSASTPMYVDLVFSSSRQINSQMMWNGLRYGSVPAMYSLTVSTAGTGANGSASISCAENHGYPSGGFLAGSSGSYYYDGTNISLQAPSANTGYHFVNWTKNSSQVATTSRYPSSGTISVSSTNSGAYVANFAANTYTVVFNANGGTGSISNQAFTYDVAQKLTANTTITRTGYTFAGWATSQANANAGTVAHTDNKSVSNLTTAQNGTVNLYAVWTPKNYTVNLDNQSATAGQASVTATYNAAMPSIATNLPAKTGHIFEGYYTTGGTKYYNADGTSAHAWDIDTNPTTLVAHWTALYTITIADYTGGTVTVSPEGGTPFTSGSQDIAAGTIITITASNAEHYTLTSLTYSDEGAISSGDEREIDGPHTITAVFTGDSYDITYLDEGGGAYSGTNGDALPDTHIYGTQTDLVDGEKSGATFEGWYDNQACDGDAITSIGAYQKSAAFTLYAKWTINNHTVTINTPENGTLTVKNGDVTVSNNAEVAHNTTLTLTATPDAGYKFGEWTGNAAASVTVDDDVTLGVSFTQKSYTVAVADAEEVDEIFPAHGRHRQRDGEKNQEHFHTRKILDGKDRKYSDTGNRGPTAMGQRQVGICRGE